MPTGGFWPCPSPCTLPRLTVSHSERPWACVSAEIKAGGHSLQSDSSVFSWGHSLGCPPEMLWVWALLSESPSRVCLECANLCLCECVPASVCILSVNVYTYCHQEISLKLFSCFNRVPQPLLCPLGSWPVRASHPGNAPSVDGREKARPHPGISAFDLGSLMGRGAPQLPLPKKLWGRSPKGVELCVGKTD